MLRILERVAGANVGSGGHRSVAERFWSNGVDIFRDIIGVAPSVVEYWMEATECIMDDLDFTDDQKLNEAVSLLHDESVSSDRSSEEIGFFNIGREGQDSRGSETLKKKAKAEGPLRVGPTVAPAGVVICQLCNRRHPAAGGVQQPPRGRGQARGDNSMGRGQRALDRGAGPTEARQPALVYVARRRGDGDAPDIITGIPSESTSSEISVVSPLGQTIRVSKLFWDISLEVQGTIFLAHLMELLFGKFDLILSMDWLVKHRISLDCAEKKVVLRTEEDNEDIRTMRGFSDVFPEELPGLPPSREVEFGIELILGTALVSIAPYQMEPKELAKLKA
ncbi:uncharacterized protein LOC108477793 [Gossypium arboreum]|uniref:uncharacterized protein LOC108477793 n=1 Tax=Gossypium arboreum TaxID=29729 RepID=UPI00081977B4|nr:uncharacterized protein LOC108477793 [Gossypium arboreum]